MANSLLNPLPDSPPRPSLAKLVRLRMSSTGLSDESAGRLFGNPRVRGPSRIVDPSRRAQGGRGPGSIASCRQLAKLKRLELSEFNLGGDSGILTRGAFWPNLRELSLWGSKLRDIGLERLAVAPPPADLRYLNLTDSGLSSSGVAELARSPLLANVRQLGLDANLIGNSGAEALAGSSFVGRLLELVLRQAEIGPAGARALAKSDRFTELKVLCLTSNPLGSEGAAALAASSHLARLESLDVVSCRLKSEGERALTKAFGDRVRVAM